MLSPIEDFQFPEAYRFPVLSWTHGDPYYLNITETVEVVWFPGYEIEGTDIKEVDRFNVNRTDNFGGSSFKVIPGSKADAEAVWLELKAFSTYISLAGTGIRLG